MDLIEQAFAAVGPSLEEVEERLRRVLAEARTQAGRIGQHLVDSGGKRVRPMITLIAARQFSDDLTPAIPVAVAAELIHMATLVHDDVIDGAELRRGQKTVNALWGNHVAVLMGDLLLARALVLLVSESTPEVVRIMSDMIYQMCQGEIAQDLKVDDLDQQEAEYFDRIEKKTALFFAACCEAGAHVAGATPEEARRMASYGRNLGMAFQVTDDLLDVSAEEDVIGKPVGNDLASGILTLPVLYLLHHPTYRSDVRNLLSGGRPGRDQIDAVLQLARRNGALDYTREVAARFADRAKSDLGAVRDGPMTDLLHRFAEAVLTRSF
ncbi:MAG TPA: polyprenyl synthetase family protein [Limnochordia bacterium]